MTDENKDFECVFCSNFTTQEYLCATCQKRVVKEEELLRRRGETG